MSNKITKKHSFREYERKYSKLNLQKVSKADADKDASLLDGKNWWVIKDTYYEVPKFKGIKLWWTNLGKTGQIVACCLGGVAVTSAIVIPTVIAVNKKSSDETKEVKVDSDEVTLTYSLESDGSIKGSLKSKAEIKDISTLEIKIGDYTLTKYEYKFDQETGEFEIYADIVKAHKGSVVITPKLVEKKEKTYLFPQTIVDDPSIELMAAGESYNDEEYFKFQNEYYVKDTAIPYEESGKKIYFSNGIEVTKGTKYYFKCEEVTWLSKSVSVNSSIMMTEKILYSAQYDSNGSASLDNSSIKNWLNNYFYNNVFKGVTSMVVPYSSIEEKAKVTNMNVWIPSASEIQTWDSAEKNRIKVVTDFAICNGAKYTVTDEKKIGTYWTRTDSGVLLNGGDCLDYVNEAGKVIGSSSGPTDKNVGVAPCVCINKTENK